MVVLADENACSLKGDPHLRQMGMSPLDATITVHGGCSYVMVTNYCEDVPVHATLRVTAEFAPLGIGSSRSSLVSLNVRLFTTVRS